MKYGFVKAAAVTPQIRVADVRGNADNIVRAVCGAAESGTELLVFPELCVCGYTCGDLFGRELLLRAAESEIAEIAARTKDSGVLFFVGIPVSAFGAVYDCAAAICGGEVLALVPKTNLSEYGEYYEKRIFSSYNGENDFVDFAGKRIPFGNKILFRHKNYSEFTVAAVVGSDLFAADSPSVRLAAAGALIVVNLTAVSETAGKSELRRLLVRSQSLKNVCGYVYADAGEGESTTDSVFSAHNFVAEYGEILSESKPFAEGFVRAEIDVEKLAFERRRKHAFSALPQGYSVIHFNTKDFSSALDRTVSPLPFIPHDPSERREQFESILCAQAAGLKKRAAHTAAESLVIGISGGLDSALALLVAVRAVDSLGKARTAIKAVTMPCFGTTGKTLDNSLRLMHELGVSSRTIPIADTVRSHFKDISHDESQKNAAYENAQARMRTLVLMDIANDENGFVIGTGDLSESALGWATYNGDHMSMYGVNASVPKTLVRHLIGYEAERLGGAVEQVLTSILDTEISPELLPPESGKIAQKTEELVGPYELHDFYLYHALRWGASPSKILFLAQSAFSDKYDKATLLKWLRNFYRRFFAQQFKRSCVPDGVKATDVSLSPRGDWRMPSDACASLWLEEIDKLK